MLTISEPYQAVYAAAVQTLAGSVVRALTGEDDNFQLAKQLPVGDGNAGLAAVRVLGPDMLAPFVLGNHRLRPDDAAVIAASLRMFPMSALGADKEDNLEKRSSYKSTIPIQSLRDWATGQMMTRLGISDFVVPYPVQAVSGVGRDRGWVNWVRVLTQLSPLALLGLDCPIHAGARRYRLDVARGVTRAMLRRDYLTAARLARWYTAGDDIPMDPSFPMESAWRQMEFVAKPDTRLLLEVTVARCWLKESGR